MWRGSSLQISRAVSGAVVISTRNQSAAADPSPAPVKYKPYSPFQNTSNAAEYAVARLDDLLNWGRKVTHNKGIYNIWVIYFT